MALLHTDGIRETFLGLSAEQLNDADQQSRTYFEAFNLFRGWNRPVEEDVSLDPLPFVVEQPERVVLEDGLAQWAHVLSAMYRDLWSEQQLVHSGILPLSDLWQHTQFEPGFSDGLPGDVAPLCVLAFTLQRSRGQWNVLSVDAERPTGLGYSLEDRIIHSRCYSSVIRPENLLRMAPYLMKLKELWHFRGGRITPESTPSVMVWTDGPDDRHYFEPVYLARYFGFPLVESRDLTVRSGRVYLKTLGGLQPVDVLMRWVPDTNLDPLVGNPPAITGVAGLAQAVRDGFVTVCNAPGAGLLGARPLISRMAEAARFFTGAELQIPVASLPGADVRRGGEPTSGSDTIVEPFWNGTSWIERPATARFFMAYLGDRWQLMPGGIVQAELPGQILRKDVWMVEDAAVPQVSLLPDGEKPAVIVRAGELPSRIADDLFWLGRYVERTWFDARILETWWKATYEAGIDAQLPMPELLTDVLRETGAAAQTDDDGQHIDPADPRAWRLATTLGEVKRMSSSLLDRLSSETHRILASLGTRTMPQSRGLIPAFFEDLNLRLAALNGLTNENMTRSAGWLFMDLGRRIERAELSLAAMTAVYSRDTSDQALTMLLDLFDSSLTYRSRYRLTPQAAPVLDLLLLDESNPRSFAFQVEQLTAHIEELPRPAGRTHRSSEERLVLELSTTVRLADAQELRGGAAVELFHRLDGMLQSLADTIHDRYLAKIDVSAALQPRLREPLE